MKKFFVPLFFAFIAVNGFSFSPVDSVNALMGTYSAFDFSRKYVSSSGNALGNEFLVATNG